MKNSFFLMLLLVPLTSYSQGKKLTATEIDERCQKLSAEKFEKYKATCWKAQEELKKAMPVSLKSEPAKVKLSDQDIVSKCLKLSEDKKIKYKNTCDQAKARLNSQLIIKKEVVKDKILLKSEQADPLFKELKNPKKSTWNIYLGYSGLLGSVKGFDLELEKQYRNFGLGAFFSQQTILDVESTGWLKGSAYGVSLKYHFYPVEYTNKFKVFNPAVFAQLGMASYESEIQGKLPSYIYTNIGFEASYPILKMGTTSQLSGFTKIGVGQIYHQESNFLHIGTGFTLGVKLEF